MANEIDDKFFNASKLGSMVKRPNGQRWMYSSNYYFTQIRTAYDSCHSIY